MRIDIEIGQVWQHANRHEYRVLHIANEHSSNPKYPITIVYESLVTGHVWCKELSNFLCRMEKTQSG